MKSSLVNMLVKEVRVWGYARPISDIQQYRYRQLTPSQYSATKLLTYVRMTEASFDEYNFASVDSVRVAPAAQFSNIRYVSDSLLVICPQESYYVRGICYQNPVNQLIGAIFPVYNSTSNSLNWIITAKYTELIDSSYFSSLLVNWDSSNAIVEYAAGSQFSGAEMVIPSSAFIDNNQYFFSLNITNYDITFSELTYYQFIPVSCHWYIVKGNNSYQSYNLYTAPISQVDINFQLVLTERVSYCSNITYYSQLVKSLGYVISPQPAVMPFINSSFADDGTINIVIPASEQSKFSQSIDYHIIFSVYWTNPQYQQILASSAQDSLFQNVMYTINFNSNGKTMVPLVTANSQQVFAEEQLVLDASYSYISGATSSQEEQDLSYSWICPSIGNLKNLCSGQTNALLVINYQDFINANGIFNQSLNFQVNITWTKGSGEVSNYYASLPITWYNISYPYFTIQPPLVISVTRWVNTFQLIFANYTQSNMNLLNIEWDFSPDITTYTLTNNNSTMAVAINGLKPSTTYVVTVVAASVSYPDLTETQTINFTTSNALSGGSAYITPDTGFVNTTQFQIGITGWPLNNGPVLFAVYSTLDPEGIQRGTQLNNEFIDSGSTFNFTSPTTNPFQIEIVDSGSETAWVTVKASISIDNSVGDTTSTTLLLQKLDLLQSQPSLKYAYMNSIVNLMQISTSSSSSTQDQVNATYIDEQVTYRDELISNIESDLKNISSPTNVANGEAKLVLSNSVSMLSTLLQTPSYLTDNLISRSLNISSTILAQKSIFGQLLTTSPVFGNQFTQTLSNFQNYASNKWNIQNSRRRVLQALATNSTQGVQALNNQIISLKNNFLSQICGNLTNQETQWAFSSSNLGLSVEQIPITSKMGAIQFAASYDKSSVITIGAQQLISEVNKISTINPSSICVQTTFYQINPVPLNAQVNQTLTQYSNTIFEQTFADQTGQKSLSQSINPSAFTTFSFGVDPSSYKSNQSVCMAFSTTGQIWSDQPCQSILDTINYLLNCLCDMVNNEYYGIFTDSSRIQGSQVLPPRASSTLTSDKQTAQSSSTHVTHSQSYSFIGVIIILLFIAIGIPIAIILLDKKDYRHSTAKIENASKRILLEKVASVSQLPLALWKFKQDQVFTYSIANKTVFSHYVTQIHPFISLFTKYDVLEARLTRFSIYLAQLSIYAIICAASFSKKYRQQDNIRNEYGLDEKDAGNIIGIGIIGMLILLPIPGINKLFRSKIVESQSNDSVSRENMNQDSPCPSVQKNGQQSNVNTVNQDNIIVAQNKYIRYGLLGFGYILWLIAFAIAIAFSKNVSIFNSYCTVASFYFGIFGSIFFSNMMRVALNFMLANKVFENQQSLIRFVVAAEAVQILKEISIVRRAEKMLYQKEDDLATPLQSKFEEEATEQSPQPILTTISQKQIPLRYQQEEGDEAVDQQNRFNDSQISLEDLPVSFKKSPIKIQTTTPNQKKQNQSTFNDSIGDIKTGQKLKEANNSRIMHDSPKYSHVGNASETKQSLKQQQKEY